MRAANEALLAKSENAEPAFTRSEIAHVAIEHGDANRCLLDEQAKLLSALPQRRNRVFIGDGWMPALPRPVLRKLMGAVRSLAVIGASQVLLYGHARIFREVLTALSLANVQIEFGVGTRPISRRIVVA